MQARLRVIGGEERARQIELRLPAIVGRSRTTDVTLFHPLVSRRHCEIFEAEGRLMVRDLGSLNGTFVGETRLGEEPVPLDPGARLTVGCITLLADYELAAERRADELAAERRADSDWISKGPTLDSAGAPVGGEDLRFDAGHQLRPVSRVERRSRD